MQICWSVVVLRLNVMDKPGSTSNPKWTKMAVTSIYNGGKVEYSYKEVIKECRSGRTENKTTKYLRLHNV